MKQCLPLAPEMEIAYVVNDAKKWEVGPRRDVSEFKTWNLLPVSIQNLKNACVGQPARAYQ